MAPPFLIMSRNDIKYSKLEEDGTDYDFPVEHIPDAQDIAFSADLFDADNAKDAIIESKEKIKEILQFNIVLQYNGNVSNGDFIGYDANMENKKVIFPFRSSILPFNSPL